MKLGNKFNLDYVIDRVKLYLFTDTVEYRVNLIYLSPVKPFNWQVRQL